MERSKTNRSAILGIVLVLIGLVLIASHLHIIPFNIRDIVFSWEMILIVIGVILLINRESSLTGWILLGIGAFFLIPDIINVPFEWHRFFWPTLFIVLGLLLIFRIGGFRRHWSGTDEIRDEDFLDDVAIFGGGQRLVTSQNFQGGRITAIFGGSQINLKQATLTKGKAYIDYFALFGGTNLIIPDDWDVKVQITPIFGGFDDKRSPDPRIIRDPGKQLIIKGVAIFGGGELKSF